MTFNEEREIHRPVLLCQPQGSLNLEARGYSRTPLHTCNLFGSWGRKKKWNWWGFGNHEVFFSLVLADLDYIALGSVVLIDLVRNERYEKDVIVPFAVGVGMGERVADNMAFHREGLSFKVTQEGTVLRVFATAYNVGGKPLRARLAVKRAAGMESLNVVIPWSERQFQFTSKQNSLPVEGIVSHGDRTYSMTPDRSFGWLDFGRGVWPYRTHWNWGTAVGRSHGHLLGLQFGGRWTDGTGATENGFLLDGKLYKLSQDVHFRYDVNRPGTPWRLVSDDEVTVDLTLTPRHEIAKAMDFGLASSDLHVNFGSFYGKVRVAGNVWPVEDFFGWAEEHIAKW